MPVGSDWVGELATACVDRRWDRAWSVAQAAVDSGSAPTLRAGLYRRCVQATELLGDYGCSAASDSDRLGWLLDRHRRLTAAVAGRGAAPDPAAGALAWAAHLADLLEHLADHTHGPLQPEPDRTAAVQRHLADLGRGATPAVVWLPTPATADPVQ